MLRKWTLVLLAFAPGTALLGQAPQPPITMESITFPAGDSETDSVPAELGRLVVPEDWSRPKARQITLRFVRFRSTSPNPSSPIVYLAGGPGGSGIAAARGTRHEPFMALREHADVNCRGPARHRIE